MLSDNIICEDGFVDIEKAATITISRLDSYHETKRISRPSYAKPGIEPKEMKNGNGFGLAEVAEF